MATLAIEAAPLIVRPGRLPAWVRSMALLGLLTAGLMLPALLAPPMRHDSFWIDLTWSEQFTALVRQGNPYPRWLPWSFGGLGAPVFYFYAPLAFHLAAAFGLAGLAAWPALLAAFGTAWLASGLAMHAWLVDKSRAPLVGAALYMVLPYHVIDFYARGALAEFCAYALLPVVALGVERARRHGGAWLLGAGYAALVMTHLPTALLASVLLIGPMLLWQAWQDRRLPWIGIGGVAGGIGGAAIYLLPALTLQSHSAIGSLWAVPFLQPSRWGLLQPALWPNPGYVLLFGGLALAIALAAALLATRPWGFWPWWTIGVAAIVAGLVPGFWSLPIVKAVQFPWRALALAEFGLVTVLADRARGPLATTAVLCPLLTLAAAMLSPANPLNGEPMKPLPLPGRQEVIEYLPPAAVAPARMPRNGRLRAVARRSANRPGSSFPFPSLRDGCGGGLAADSREPLLVHAGPQCRIVVGRLPAERLGLAIGLLTLATGSTAAALRRRRRARRALGSPAFGA